MFDFAETTKDMTAVEILNYYRNLYYAEPQVTERGIVSNAINDYFKQTAPKSEWISVVEDPPDEEAWVMGYEGPGNYEIVKIEKGIDEETRDKMRAGDINDPETQGWTAADGLFVIKRSKVFKAADVFGNNKVPYCWKTKSGHTIFGQNITWWRPLPEPPEGD